MTFAPLRSAPFAALLGLGLALPLAGCGDNSVRYLAGPEAPAKKSALRYRSMEVREVLLPDYAEAPEILREEEGGGLVPVKGAIWGDGSAQAVTAALTASLGLRVTTPVAAEPWPLAEDPDARLHVRIDRMVATAAGTFSLSGQFALERPDGGGGELIQRFAVEVPVAGDGPGDIANAKGRAIDALADQIVARLRR